MNIQNQLPVETWERVLGRNGRSGVLGKTAVAFMYGFCLSAAALNATPLPLCMVVLCVGLSPWQNAAFALGGGLGYWVFWGNAGAVGMAWIAGGLAVGVLLDAKRKNLPLLLPSVGALITAVSGLAFQLWDRDAVSVGAYMLQLAAAFAGVALAQAAKRRTMLTDSAVLAVAVLALARVIPSRYLNAGILAATVVALKTTLPAAVMCGLALDVSGVTTVPMAAVMGLIFLTGRIAWMPKKSRVLFPAAIYLAVMALCAVTDFAPIAPLILGGTLSLFAPKRRAEETIEKKTDDVRTQMETLASVFTQMGQLLRDVPRRGVDEGALIARAAERACGSCERRNDCLAAERIKQMPQSVLHRSSITQEDVPSSCRKKERLLAQLQQSQDHYRLLQADRQRHGEYRAALVQQYGFLAEQLLKLSDEHRQNEKTEAAYRVEVAVCSRGKESTNGDRCLRFAATGSRYYLVLCDGMGTGEGAAYEARIAGTILRRLLEVGCTETDALQCVNSLCVLRGSAGAVSIDLAQIDLKTGRGSLYKWGAAPSWILTRSKWEKIGRECPPPGVSLEDDRETVDRFTLRDGEVLMMFSDGVDAESALAEIADAYEQPAGFLAALSLETGRADIPDDATAAVLRLHPIHRETDE